MKIEETNSRLYTHLDKFGSIYPSRNFNGHGRLKIEPWIMNEVIEFIWLNFMGFPIHDAVFFDHSCDTFMTRRLDLILLCVRDNNSSNDEKKYCHFRSKKKIIFSKSEEKKHHHTSTITMFPYNRRIYLSLKFVYGVILLQAFISSSLVSFSMIASDAY